MSSYANFMLRGTDDNFYPICSYSRSHPIYGTVCNYAPYEKVRVLNENILKDFKGEAQNNINEFKEAIEEQKTLKEDVCSVKGANLEEVVEYIHGYNNSIKDYSESIEEWKSAIAFFDVLLDILDEIKYSEEEKYDKLKDNYLYVGIDIGYNITAEDIVE